MSISSDNESSYFTGHSAKDCPYSLMENTTKKIVAIKVINKVETENKSTNMEYAGFVATMVELKNLKLDVVEVVTDSHSKITSVLSNQLFS